MSTTDSYPYSAPDFGGDAARPNEINIGKSSAENPNGTHMSNPNDDVLRSVLDGYKPPSTPSDLPPHVPTPPELANRQLGHSKTTLNSTNDSDSNDIKSTSSRTQSKSLANLNLPSPEDIAKAHKNGNVDTGFIEKVGSTAMQSEQERSKSNSHLGFGLNKARSGTTDSAETRDGGKNEVNGQQQQQQPASRTSTQNGVPGGDAKSAQSSRGTSGRPQKGDAGYEEPHEEEQGAARGEAAPPSQSSTAQDGDVQQQGAEGENRGGGAQGQNDDIYPEQRHAGKLEGVGPEYGAANRVTISDRIQGVKEQIKGAILRKPDVKERGKERMTGELKKKEKEDEANMDPFGTAPDNDDSEEKPGDEKGDSDNADDSSKANDQGDEEQRPNAPSKGSSRTNNQYKSSESTERDNNLGKSSTVLNNPSDRKDGNEQHDADAGLSEVPQAHPTEKGKVEQAANVQPEGEQNSEPEQRAHENATTGQVNADSY